MSNAEEIRRWIDKSALTELVAALSAAVDRADKQAIIDCLRGSSRTGGLSLMSRFRVTMPPSTGGRAETPPIRGMTA